MIKISTLPPHTDYHIKQFVFAGGEAYVQLPPIGLAHVKIAARLTNSDEIMKLLLVVDALRRQSPAVKIDLDLPYLPYARQDRVCEPGESLSVVVMADLINRLELNQVTILDCHSDVGTALIRRCKVISAGQLIKESFPDRDWSQTTLVAPDAGALKKTHFAAQLLGAKAVIHCSKIRDTKTGRITATEVPKELDGAKLFVMDDIFDGGRTFVELGRAIRAQNPASLELWVTHGIFSKGYDEVKELYSHVYSTNSFHHAANGNTRPDGIVDTQFSFFQV